ncbi:MAG TPA: hypothetical protein VIV60_22830, partial [Polyangiaceae bacterium]
NGLGTTCRMAGDQCASADDCCNDAPCVRDTQGVLRCYVDGQCVPRGGSCTITGDCCPGSTCIRSAGSTSGSCGTPVSEGTGGASGAAGASGVSGSPGASGASNNAQGGGPSCSEYGQMCSGDADCCNAIPCYNGTCHIQIM